MGTTGRRIRIIGVLTSLQLTVNIGFMDDITLSGKLKKVKQDIITIMDLQTETGLRLNSAKCEIIADDFTRIDNIDTFRDLISVHP